MKASKEWPLPRERDTINKITRRRALRISDKTILKQMAKWETWPQQYKIRDYVVDPLPRLIARAYADFLFGEDPEITAANETDQKWIDEIVKENRLTSELHRGARISVSEGEVWWKDYIDRDVALVPLIDFSSRLGVVPLWRGPRLLACAFVTTVARVKASEASTKTDVVWRHLELHGEGVVRHLLFRGDDGEIGTEQPLTARVETQDLVEEWKHGLPMLAGRIVNDIDCDNHLGESEYDQVEDLLLGLNEARTIGAENTRLTAKKRLFITGELLEQDGSFDAGSDIIQVSPEGASLGADVKDPPVKAVEYSYDAAPLILHNQDLVRTILNRVGIVPQFVGTDVDGQAESGTAIRLRFLPTVNAAQGKAREWDDKLPKILQLTMQLDALPEVQQGFGRKYSQVGEPPAVERSDVLPTDETEDVKTHVVAVTGEVESRRTAISAMHPDWDDTRVDEELDEIKKDAGDYQAVVLPEVPPKVSGDQIANP